MYLSSGLSSGKSYPQELRALPDGDAGVRKTLLYMQDFKDQAKTMPEIRRLAHSIISGVAAKDSLGEISAIQDWVRKNIRYTWDVVGVETLQRPDVTVGMRHGDCDDHSTLVAALAESIGLPARFVAMGNDEFEHVYAEVFLPEHGWMSVETTESVPVGWDPEFRRKMVV